MACRVEGEEHCCHAPTRVRHTTHSFRVLWISLFPILAIGKTPPTGGPSLDALLVHGVRPRCAPVLLHACRPVRHIPPKDL